VIDRYLPPRLRVALAVARKDARDAVRAFVEPRQKGARVRVRREREGTRRAAAVAAKAAVREAAEGAAVVVFGESGVEVSLEPGQSILEAGLRNGVDLLFSCTVGGCGACILQIVEGEVEYEEPDAICLTPEEIAHRCCLACVGRPRGRVVVEA